MGSCKCSYNKTLHIRVSYNTTTCMGCRTTPLHVWGVVQHHYMYGVSYNTTTCMGCRATPLHVRGVVQHHYMYGVSYNTTTCMGCRTTPLHVRGGGRGVIYSL